MKRGLAALLSFSLGALSLGPEASRAMAQSLRASGGTPAPAPYSPLRGAALAKPYVPAVLPSFSGLSGQLGAQNFIRPAALALPAAGPALEASVLSLAAAASPATPLIPAQAALSASLARESIAPDRTPSALERAGARLAARAESASPLLQGAGAPASDASLHSLGLRLEEWFFRDPSQAAAEPAQAAPRPLPQLRRSAQAAPGEPSRADIPPPPGPSRLYGLGLLGLSIPLSAWPQILPLAAAGFVLSALILYDIATKGALSSGAFHFFQRRSLAKNVERDLPGLFDFPRDREAEPRQLQSFVAQFRRSDKGARQELLKEAAQDPELWRQKLLLAYLAEASSAGAQAALEALKSSSRPEPLDPLILQLLAKRKDFSWLQQTQALRRLSQLGLLLDAKPQKARAALVELASESDPLVRANALAALSEAGVPKAAKRSSWAWRISAALMAAATALLLFMTATAWVKTGEFRRQQEQAASDMLKDRFGKYMYIFSRAQYTDENIKQKVLPALERWSRNEPESVGAIEEAVELLRRSTDSRSDNVLEALLDQIDYISDQAGDRVLATLMERKSDEIWRFMTEYISKNSLDPKSAQRMIRMIELASTSADDRVFLNTFHFLKSPNPFVRQAASQSISASLNNQALGDFQPRMEAVLQKHGGDPDLNIWAGWFLLNRFNSPGAENVQTQPVVTLMQRVVDGAWAADHNQPLAPQPPPLGQPPQAQPPRAMAARPQPGQQLAQGQQQPPPYTAQTFGMMSQVLDNAPNGKVPDQVKQAVQSQYHRVAKNLISESLPLFPGLQRRLENAGVLRLSAVRSAPYDHSGSEAFGPVGTPSLRDAYTLAHLNDFSRELRAAALESQKAGGLNPAAQEGRDRLRSLGRTFPIVVQMQRAGAKAGIPADAPAAKAADEVNDMLMAGHTLIYGWKFIESLRNAGLAAPTQAGNAMENFLPAYDRETLGKLHRFFEDYLANDQSYDQFGAGRTLSDDERAYLIKSLDRIEALRAKYFPSPEDGPAESASLGRRLFAMRQGLPGAEEALERSYAQAAVKDSFLHRLAAAQSDAGYADNADFQLRALRFLSQKLASADGRGLSEAPARRALDRAFDTAQAAGKSKEAWAILNSALDAARGNNVRHPALENMVRSRLNSSAGALGREAEGIFSAQNARPFAKGYLARVGAAGLRAGDGTYRDGFTRYHMRELRAAIEEAYKAWEADASAAPPTEQQKAFKTRALEGLDILLQAAEKAGVSEGSAAGVRAADAANQALAELDLKFWQNLFSKAMLQAGLERKDSYTAEELKKLRDFANALAESGRLPDGINATQKIDDYQQRALARGAERLDGVLAQFFPDSAKEKGLGRLVLALRNPAEAGSAQKALAKALDVPGPLLLSRLYAVQSVYKDDPETQAWVLKTLSTQLAGPKGAALDPKPAAELLRDGLQTMAGLGKAEQAWSLLDKGGPEPLSRQVRLLVRDSTRALIESAETAWADSADLRGDFLQAGLRATQWEHRNVYKLKDLEALRKIILERASASAKDGLTAGQKQAKEQAQRLLPLWLKAGKAAGMLPGDSPGEKAAARVNATLWEGHRVFSGSEFLKELRRKGLAPEPPDPSVNTETNLRQSYSPKDVEAVRDFLKALLDKGKGWDWYGSPRDLSTEEKLYLRQAVVEVDKVLRTYPQPASLPPAAPKTRMPAFSPLMFLGAGGLFAQIKAPAVPADGFLIPAMVGLVLIVGFFFLLRLVFSLLGGSKAPAVQERTALPEDVLRQRLEMLEMAARRTPTSVLVGNFRSRRAGQGTEFLESREYQPGDPIPRIDWNATGRSERVYTKTKLEEKDKKVILLIDASNSSGIGTQKTTKWTVIQDAAALYVLLAARLGLKAGAYIFTDQKELYIEPGKLSAQALAHEIIAFRAKGQNTDLRKPLDFVRENFRDSAFVVMISDFDWDQDFTEALIPLTQRHDFRPVRVTDPSDLTGIPPVDSLVPVRDSETGSTVWVDPSSESFQRDQAVLIGRREARLRTIFDREGIQEPILLSTDGNHVDRLAENLTGKKRQ